LYPRHNPESLHRTFRASRGRSRCCLLARLRWSYQLWHFALLDAAKNALVDQLRLQSGLICNRRHLARRVEVISLEMVTPHRLAIDRDEVDFYLAEFSAPVYRAWSPCRNAGYWPVASASLWRPGPRSRHLRNRKDPRVFEL